AKQLAVRARRFRIAAGRDVAELARIAALRIVSAADEGAVLAGNLEAEPPGLARGAATRIGAVLPWRKDVRTEDLVQRFQHLADAQILDVVDGAGELAPEIAQHVLPGELAVGNEVELVLEVGGEIVFDIALEEALEERDD